MWESCQHNTSQYSERCQHDIVLRKSQRSHKVLILRMDRSLSRSTRDQEQTETFSSYGGSPNSHIVQHVLWDLFHVLFSYSYLTPQGETSANFITFGALSVCVCLSVKSYAATRRSSNYSNIGSRQFPSIHVMRHDPSPPAPNIAARAQGPGHMDPSGCPHCRHPGSPWDPWAPGHWAGSTHWEVGKQVHISWHIGSMGLVGYWGYRCHKTIFKISERRLVPGLSAHDMHSFVRFAQARRHCVISAMWLRILPTTRSFEVCSWAVDGQKPSALHEQYRVFIRTWCMQAVLLKNISMQSSP